ncbi:hypothetical protein [Streptomyces sp. JJ38]|uniref:hypothetical protein n=1 Tax=Streptomyces sp. JJ38 TaxID=2738128 RepID=UPI00214BAFBD|nr:hypothetical protein [Streptomyces sp. JJ38]
MDCYRLVGENRLARNLAEQILRDGTDFDGTERSPMRNAEARVTLGVTAARSGDLEQALVHGQGALTGARQSTLSLVMASRELSVTLRSHFGDDPATVDYLSPLRELGEEIEGSMRA